MDRDIKDFAKTLLRQEWDISYGCTDPAAVGFAASAAASLLGEPVQHVKVTLDLGTYKNTLAVNLPGFDGRGPKLAAAVGALIAEPEMGLRIFELTSETTWQEAKSLVEEVEVTTSHDSRELMIKVEVQGMEHRAEAEVTGRHNHLSSCRRNGICVFKDRPEAMHTDPISTDEILRRIPDPTSVWALVQLLDDEDLKTVEKAWKTNHAVAQASLKGGFGLEFGKAMKEINHADSMAGLVKAWVGAGIDARMSGYPGAVVSSGGSGSNGITVTLGPWAVAEALGIKSQRRINQAIAIAHFFNIAVKARIGRVSPLCGGVLSAALGVGCAASWLLGSGVAEMDSVIRYMINTHAGTLCDGAKPACAYKICAALTSGLDAARMAASGLLKVGDDGLGGSEAATGLQRLASLAAIAYANTDLSLNSILRENGTALSV